MIGAVLAEGLAIALTFAVFYGRARYAHRRARWHADRRTDRR